MTPRKLAAFAQPPDAGRAEFADEMEDFFPSVIKDHPEIDDLVLKLADAVEKMDQEEADAALDELVSALSRMNPKPSYPKLSKSERKKASKKIRENIHEGKYASREQAIAVALRQAAPEKYKKFDRKKRKKRRR